MTGVGTAEVTRFRQILAQHFGWSSDRADPALLSTVLRRRAEQGGSSLREYLSQLGAAPSKPELAALAEELTITETYFFRNAEQFRAVADVVLPERMRARSQQRRLRLLSVGCASGEEAYTLAIVARESVTGPAWDVSVLGLDVNPAMLRKAAEARYSRWSMRETPTPVRHRWFREDGGSFHLDPQVRSAVRFLQYNVADNSQRFWPAEEYDVIFCRNLLMYLQPETAQILVGRMTHALAPGGYLFLGHTDTLGGEPPGLQVRHSHETFYYQRTAGTAAQLSAGTAAQRSADRQHATESPPARAVGNSRPAPPARTAAESRPDAPSRREPDPTVDPTRPSHRPARAPAAGPAALARTTAHPAGWEAAVRLLREERFSAALDVVGPLAASSDGPELGVLHGVLLLQTGQLRQAIDRCRRVLARDDLNPDAHHLLAMCHEDDVDGGVAFEHYRLAAYLEPRFAMPRLRLGLLARRFGERRSAAAELHHAISLLPTERDHRILLFGGGFGRHALIALCRAELDAGQAAP